VDLAATPAGGADVVTVKVVNGESGLDEVAAAAGFGVLPGHWIWLSSSGASPAG
jgi:hypothetical protein